jgi:hypothetical protein
VGGRTFGGGAYPDVAVASTYLVFAGMLAAAAYAFMAAKQAGRPAVLQLLELSLFLYGAIMVAYGFNRGAAVAGSILLAVMVLLGALGWPDLKRAWR